MCCIINHFSSEPACHWILLELRTPSVPAVSRRRKDAVVIMAFCVSTDLSVCGLVSTAGTQQTTQGWGSLFICLSHQF